MDIHKANLEITNLHNSPRMKRINIITTIIFLFSLSAIAQTNSEHNLDIISKPISEEAAKAKALEFFSTDARKLPAKNGGKRKAPTVQDVKLSYTSVKEGKTCFYVFNNGEDGGFVIVGGDEVAKEILAYVPHGHFDYEKAPDNVKWWLGEYEKEIFIAKKVAAQKQHNSVSKRSSSSVQDLFTDIPDLITTKWDQLYPYNAAIPEIQHTNGSSIVSSTGCVNTAVAQIMNYWKWPITGEGSNSYTLDYDGIDEWSAGVAEGSFDGLLPATFSANFGSTTYDWENMLDDYTVATPTQAQIDAVSTLMYHVGVSEYTSYGPGGSGGGPQDMMKALKDNFKYSERLTYLLRGDYLDDEWEEIIYSELQNGRPVLYDGLSPTSNDVGHCFILHGYSKDLNMFSVNWGWGGYLDGYWKIVGTISWIFFNDENYVEDFIGHGICINLEPNNIAHSNSFSNVGDTIIVDGIRYDLIGPLSKTVEVTFAPNDEIIYEGELTIPETITFNNETYTVTKIGRYGLASGYANYYGVDMGGISAITSIQLPNTLRSIAYGGLTGANIRELHLPESVEMLGKNCFSAMGELTTVTLPNNLTYIPLYCFNDCHKLEYVNLPASIKALGAMSFADCPSLELLVSHAVSVPTATIDVDRGIPALFSSNLEGKVLAVPQSSIGDYKNDSQFGLWGTIIPIESLPENFEERFEVDSIEYKFLLTGEVSVVGYKGKRNDIDSLVIPASVSYKGNKYPVVKVGNGGHFNMFIQSIIIDDGIREIGTFAFSGNNRFNYISLPGTVELIGNSAFQSSGLISIDGANGVREIGDAAFLNCVNIENFVMPNSVEKIGNSAFADCRALTQLELSANLISIGEYAFVFCDKLQSIKCNSVVPPVLGNNAFQWVHSDIPVFVPSGTAETYRSDVGWSYFTNIIDANSIILGDVNLDEKVNVTDVVDIVNDRLGYESAGFVPMLSDVNKDEQYTITDAIAVLNIMYDEPISAITTSKKIHAQGESLNLRQPNNSTIALDLNCTNGYAAFQFEVELPEGIELEGISLNKNKCKGFAVRFNKVDDNVYKVVAYNLANEPLITGNGNLLTLSISGANAIGEIRLANIHFSTLKAVDVMFENLVSGVTTSIQSHTNPIDNIEYSIGGLRVNNDYRGTVIVNGKKVIRK